MRRSVVVDRGCCEVYVSYIVFESILAYCNFRIEGLFVSFRSANQGTLPASRLQFVEGVQESLADTLQYGMRVVGDDLRLRCAAVVRAEAGTVRRNSLTTRVVSKRTYWHFLLDAVGRHQPDREAPAGPHAQG